MLSFWLTGYRVMDGERVVWRTRREVDDFETHLAWHLRWMLVGLALGFLTSSFFGILFVLAATVAAVWLLCAGSHKQAHHAH